MWLSRLFKSSSSHKLVRKVRETGHRAAHTGEGAEPQGSHEGADLLRPEAYFDAARLGRIKNSVQSLDSIEMADIQGEDSHCIVRFERGGKKFEAHFTVTPEENGMTYRMERKVQDAHGKTIFETTQDGLDLMRIEMSLIYTFSLAFLEE